MEFKQKVGRCKKATLLSLSKQRWVLKKHCLDSVYAQRRLIDKWSPNCLDRQNFILKKNRRGDTASTIDAVRVDSYNILEDFFLKIGGFFNVYVYCFI